MGAPKIKGQAFFDSQFTFVRGRWYVWLRSNSEWTLLFKPVVFQLSYALESPGCPGHISVPKSEIFRDGSQAPSLGSSSDNSMMQPRLRVTAVGCPGVEPSSFPFSGQLGLALILVEWVVY